MMKKNSLRQGLLAIVTSIALMTAGVAVATQADDQYGCQQMKGDRHGHGGHMRKMFRGLDLSDEQRAEIKNLMTAHKAQIRENRPSAEDREARKAQMLELITATNFDPEQARLVLAAKQELRQQRVIGMMELQSQVYQLLTPEQQVKFKQRFEKRHSRKDGHKSWK